MLYPPCAFEKIDDDSIKIQVCLNFHYNQQNKTTKKSYVKICFMFAQTIEKSTGLNILWQSPTNQKYVGLTKFKL